MGIVKITANKTEGRYSCELVKDTANAAKLRQRLLDELAKLTDGITALGQQLAAANNAVTAQSATVDQAVSLLADRQAQEAQLTADAKAKQDEIDQLNKQLVTKQALQTQLQNQLAAGGLSQPDIDSINSDLALLATQITNLNNQITTASNEKKALEAQIAALQDPSDTIKAAEEQSAQLLGLAQTRDQIRDAKAYLELEKAAKTLKVNAYDDAVKTDSRDIWCVDYETELQPGDTADDKYVSIEINAANNHILLAPRTYVVTQGDIDAKQATIAAKTAEKDAKQAAIAAAEQALADTNQALAQQEQAQRDESLARSRLGPGLSPAALELALLESDGRMKKLVTEITRLIEKAAEASNQRQRLFDKQRKLTLTIAELNADKAVLAAALASTDQIVRPPVNQYTKQLQPTQASAPAAVFFNKSLLPGVQRWRPTYRTATITALNGDVCTVALDVALSTQQKLDINPSTLNNAPVTLTNVPIKYGDCNGDVFQVGDNVVLAYLDQDIAKPVVIGFQDHPRECAKGGIVVYPVSDSAAEGWGLPLADAQGIPINPPVGTVGGSDHRHIVDFKKSIETPKLRRNIKDSVVGGKAYWTDGKRTLSWASSPFGDLPVPPFTAAYGANPSTTLSVDLSSIGHDFLGCSFFDFGTGIYSEGKRLATTPFPVLGAAYLGENIVCICNVSRLEDRAYLYKPLLGTWTDVGSVIFTDIDASPLQPDGTEKKYTHRAYGYRFSRDGTKAIGLVHYYKFLNHSFSNNYLSYTFDAEGELTSQRALNACTIQRLTFSYDTAGGTASIADNSATDHANYFESEFTPTETLTQDGEITARVYSGAVTKNEIILAAGFNGNNEQLLTVTMAQTAFSNAWDGFGPVSQETFVHAKSAAILAYAYTYDYKLGGVTIADGHFNQTLSWQVVSAFPGGEVPDTKELSMARVNDCLVPAPIYADLSTGFFCFIDFSITGNETLLANYSTRPTGAYEIDSLSRTGSITLAGNYQSTNRVGSEQLFTFTAKPIAPALDNIAWVIDDFVSVTGTRRTLETRISTYLNPGKYFVGVAKCANQGINKGVFSAQCGIGFDGISPVPHYVNVQYLLDQNPTFVFTDLPGTHTPASLIGAYGDNQYFLDVFRV